LTNTQNSERRIRRYLLTTVSALALLTSVSTRGAKAADDDIDHPTIWIELGGQLEHVSGQGDNFPVGFLAANTDSPVLQGTTPLQAQNPPPFSFGEEGKISFQPQGSGSVFSAAVNYGRSSNFKHVDHQTNGVIGIANKSGVPTPNENLHGTDDFADTQEHRRESHAVLDFSVGKDVGLGMFGRDASSTLSLGLRFAQFASNATFDVRARPNIQFKYAHITSHETLKLPHFNTYHNTGQASRSFHGIGPSLSWNASAPFAGSSPSGELIFDWGANAALLFGRQRARVQHKETAHYFHLKYFPNYHPYSTVYQHPPAGHSGVRAVTVPNVGGFASASYRIENFKISLGYRADFFFGAIDGGIDAAKKENVGFYGPFASVSVGIGG
jgi:hypothetical protein